jgi:hypothetical protein
MRIIRVKTIRYWLFRLVTRLSGGRGLGGGNERQHGQLNKYRTVVASAKRLPKRTRRTYLE